MADLATLSYKDTKTLVRAAIMADQPLTIEGPPGVGKTAMIYALGEELNMEVVVLILSQCEPTDIGGFPVVSPDGSCNRLPLGPIKVACDKPVLLFLDELTTAPPAVQGAALRLVYERYAGERKLHPGTRIVAAQNSVEQAAGGWEMALPLIGRVTRIKMAPFLDEVQDFFYNLGKEGSNTRLLAVDFAATLNSDTHILQMDPPRNSSTTGDPWAAPRAWERAIKTCAQLLDSGVPETSNVFMAALAGNLGQETATAFMAIRKVRDQLPSKKEIEDNPDTAKLPSNVETEVAAMGVIAQVCTTDPCAALVYAGRMKNDVRVATFRMIIKQFRYTEHKNSKWYAKAHDMVTASIKELGKSLKNG